MDRNEAIKIVKSHYPANKQMLNSALETLIPELKESEDERIRKALIDIVNARCELYKGITKEMFLAWLEKKGTPAELSEEEQNKFAKGVLTSCALSFIDYLDAHKYEGKMCVSNGECEDIENAFHNAMWDRLHRYYCKYIEKKGEQKPAKPTLDIEIPFGRDSELIEETMTIPEGCYAFVDGNKVIIRKGEKPTKKPAECKDLDELVIRLEETIGTSPHSRDTIKEFFQKAIEIAQKPTWSEDDEEMFKYAIGHFEIQKRNSIEGGLRKISMQEFIDWIKSLKDRLM